jgi:hypothetical protein
MEPLDAAAAVAFTDDQQFLYNKTFQRAVAPAVRRLAKECLRC